MLCFHHERCLAIATLNSNYTSASTSTLTVAAWPSRLLAHRKCRWHGGDAAPPTHATAAGHRSSSSYPDTLSLPRRLSRRPCPSPRPSRTADISSASYHISNTPTPLSYPAARLPALSKAPLQRPGLLVSRPHSFCSPLLGALHQPRNEGDAHRLGARRAGRLWRLVDPPPQPGLWQPVAAGGPGPRLRHDTRARYRPGPSGTHAQAREG